MGNIETGYDGNDLPKQLEGISNKGNFLDLYENIKSWYDKDFTDNEFKIIKKTRDDGCKDFGILNSERIKKLGNRIDSELFKFNYPSFTSLNEYLTGNLENVDSQRKFREILMKLEREFGELYSSEVSLIENTLKNEIQKKPSPSSQVFDQIYNNLLKNINSNRNENMNNPDQGELEGESNELDEFSIDNLWKIWENTPGRIPAKEIELMINISISDDFSEVKDLVLSNISFESLHGFDEKADQVIFDDEKINYIKKYIEAVFNDFAKKIDDHFGGRTPPNIFGEENLYIIIDYFNAIVTGEETSATNLVQIFLEKLYENDDIVQRDIDSIRELEGKLANKIDEEEVDQIEITEEEKRYIMLKTASKKLSDEIIYQYKLYKYLSKKKTDFGKLDPDLEELLQGLTRTFKYVKKRVLKEISLTKEGPSFTQEYSPIQTDSLAEYATGNIKDIKPIAIVETNEDIRNYVYGDGQDIQNEGLEDISFSSLPDSEKKRLFQILIDRNKNNKEFNRSRKYINELGYIDLKKAKADNIDPRSLNNNVIKIQQMIVDLAREERQMEGGKSRIKEISMKRSAMVCCFRAISSFFNTVNNNGENFASEFEIDKDEDIKFNEGVITMEGTIGANKNHIKLYYDTNTGTLEFDNFLAFDSETNSYKIGLGNGEKERVNIKLPTMDQMLGQANSINLSGIDRLPLNMEQYERMVGFAMGESIWLNCFVGFLGTDIEVSQMMVEQFNEKNILKQDIINNFYGNFYAESDIKEKLGSCLLINESNEPEQFKLIKMISDTIDNCSSSNELLRFRNAMNELDDIITNNHELVKDDPLLKYLFADNLVDNSDVIDTSKGIMRQENEDLSVSPSDDIATYESQQRYENRGSTELNYRLFLSLLTDKKGIINTEAFEFALNDIKTSGKHLLDNKTGLLWDNYQERMNKDFPDLLEIENVQRHTAQELHDLEENVRLDNELGEQLDAAYSQT